MQIRAQINCTNVERQLHQFLVTSIVNFFGVTSTNSKFYTDHLCQHISIVLHWIEPLHQALIYMHLYRHLMVHEIISPSSTPHSTLFALFASANITHTSPISTLVPLCCICTMYIMYV